MTELYHDEYTGDRWTYGGRFRPMGYGTIPRGFILDSHRPGLGTPETRHGMIDYPRPLTAQECYDFELTFISTTFLGEATP